MFIFQKKANLVLPLSMAIRKVAYINSSLPLILFLRTNLEQLEENIYRLAQTLGVCRIKQNKKWAKYLVQKVLKRIMTLNGIKNVTTKIVKQTFQIFCDIKPE